MGDKALLEKSLRDAIEKQDAALAMWKRLLNERAYQSVKDFVDNERHVAMIIGNPEGVIGLTSKDIRDYIYSIGLGYNSFDFNQ